MDEVGRVPHAVVKPQAPVLLPDAEKVGHERLLEVKLGHHVIPSHEPCPGDIICSYE